jgi:hypothetical protein
MIYENPVIVEFTLENKSGAKLIFDFLDDDPITIAARGKLVQTVIQMETDEELIITHGDNPNLLRLTWDSNDGFVISDTTIGWQGNYPSPDVYLCTSDSSQLIQITTTNNGTPEIGIQIVGTGGLPGSGTEKQ